jgi:hypothetical protein
MTPLIEIPVPLLLQIGVAAGAYALIARRSTPRLERKQPVSVKTNATRHDANVTAVTATGV